MVAIKRRITLNKNNKKVVKKTTNKKKVPANNPVGRPTLYTEMIGAYICRELQSGRTITKICKEAKVPSLPTVCTWLNHLHPMYKEEFANSYKEARRFQAEVLADETKDIAEDDKNDNNTKVSRDTLRVATNKWLASKMNPTKFSDKMQVTGADGKDLIPATPTKVIFNLVKPE